MPILHSLLGLSGLFSYIARRILASLPVLFMIVLVSFLMIRAIPGGPFVASGQRAQTAEVIAAMKKYYGLDRPLLLNLPGSSPDWQLLHYVDEPISERVEVVSLKAETQKIVQMLANNFHVAGAPPNNVRPRDQAWQRIAFYAEQGVTRAEMPALLDDLRLLQNASDGGCRIASKC